MFFDASNYLSGPTGFEIETIEGPKVHVCFSDEVPELVAWLRENFAHIFAATETEEVEK